MLGGGIYVCQSSELTMSRSIVSGNDGYGIYEAYSGQPGSKTGGVSMCHTACSIKTPAGDLYDVETDSPVSGAALLDDIGKPTEAVKYGYTHILDGAPQHEKGPLDGYYLTQTSSAVDPFNDADYPTAEDALLNTFTTDKSGALDTGKVDLGYHYDDPTTVDKYRLTCQIKDENGDVPSDAGVLVADPDLLEYYRGSIVDLNYC